MWWQIVTGLQTRGDAAGLITWAVSVDSTTARAHQHALLATAELVRRERARSDKPRRQFYQAWRQRPSRLLRLR